MARAGSRHPMGTGMWCWGAPVDVGMARWHRRGLSQHGDSGAEPGAVAGGAGSSLAPGRGPGVFIGSDLVFNNINNNNN